MKKKISGLIIWLILTSVVSADNDCCGKDAIRILEQFHTTFRAKCIQIVKDSLSSMLPRNKELQKNKRM